MVYIFLFLLTAILDGDNLLGGTKIIDLLGVLILLFACIKYFPIRRSRLHYTPIVNPISFAVFILFYLMVIISFWRTHNFLISNTNIIKTSLVTTLFPIVMYLAFQYEVQKNPSVPKQMVLIIIHVMALFCFVNIIYTFANPVYGDVNSALLKAVGISQKKYIFSLYEGVHPNTIGSLGGMLMVLSAGCVLHFKFSRFKQKALYLSYCFTGFVVAVLGDSRGTLFGAIICIALLYAFVKTRQYPILKYLVFLFPFSHMIFLGIVGNIAESDAAENISRDSKDLSTGNSRKFIYETANNELADFKPIHFIGYGEYGIYGAGLTMYYIEKFGELLPSEQVMISVAHNSAVQAIFDTGYIGTFFYIMLMFIAFHKSQKLYKKGQDPFILITFFLLYYMITGMSETYFGKYAKFQYFMLLYLSFVVLLSANYEGYLKKYGKKKERLKTGEERRTGQLEKVKAR